MKTQRHGLSLLELLIVLSIMSALVALLLPAIIAVRLAALRTQSVNNLRQIGLALHSAADIHDGWLPGVAHGLSRSPAEDAYVSIFHMGIYPYLDLQPHQQGYVKLFISPADPTVIYNPDIQYTSYVPNWSAVPVAKRLTNVQDGTSQTIILSERYCLTHNPVYALGAEQSNFYCVTNQLTSASPPPGVPLTRPIIGYGRRPSFADPSQLDVLPVTDPATGVTRASDPGMTFQVRPRPEEANTFVVQTPFTAGLPVALFDGSVRVLSPRISEGTFWSLVTPAAGDVPGDY